MLKLAERIINGYRMTSENDYSIFETADLEELCESADQIRRALCGDQMDLCTIINGRSGRCSEDCKFCAQSGHHCTGIDEYGFIDQKEIEEDCARVAQKGLNRYSIVTAGRGLHGEDFDKAVAAFQLLHEKYDIELCASSGFETKEELLRLKEAGVYTIHENLETSRNFFPNICTTHTYDDKIREIKLAKSLGLHVCSGGIIGMGESMEDRRDMALALAELDVYSIPINILQPIPGTPLQGCTRLTEAEILRTVAMFRFINPTSLIRIAAGRNYFAAGGRKLFTSGANATITGDMLTTVGNNTDQDLQMLRELGYHC